MPKSYRTHTRGRSKGKTYPVKHRQTSGREASGFWSELEAAIQAYDAKARENQAIGQRMEISKLRQEILDTRARLEHLSGFDKDEQQNRLHKMEARLAALEGRDTEGRPDPVWRTRPASGVSGPIVKFPKHGIASRKRTAF